MANVVMRTGYEYTGHNWQDDNPPALNALNLNVMDSAISRHDKEIAAIDERMVDDEEIYNKAVIAANEIDDNLTKLDEGVKKVYEQSAEMDHQYAIFKEEEEEIETIAKRLTDDYLDDLTAAASEAKDAAQEAMDAAAASLNASVGWIFPYITVPTGGAVAAKKGILHTNIESFATEDGAISLNATFANTNTAPNPTLAVQKTKDGTEYTDPAPIYYNGEPIPRGYLKANETYQFVYRSDLDRWELVSTPDFRMQFNPVYLPKAVGSMYIVSAEN